MIVSVPISKIKPNPFQMRKKYDIETIKGLAEEIKNFGFWKGSLKARKVGRHYELCYGHRRLEALKSLGWKEVELDLVKLSDDEMLTQSLVENLQREDLTELEKAQGIQYMIDRLVKTGMSKEDALNQTCKIMGLSKSWILNLLKLLKMEPEVRRAIKQRRIAGRTALEAYQFGGKQMVKTAIKHKMGVHTISKIAQNVRKVGNDKIQDKLRQEVISGKRVSPEEVEERAIQLVVKDRSDEVNISGVISEWTSKLNTVSNELQNLVSLKDHIKRYPLQAAHLKVVVRKLVHDLNKLL